ncbi:Uncharacterised protein [Vibrio cholerae]|nr:Uncharacterised protein [Vibrio cholerae]
MEFPLILIRPTFVPLVLRKIHVREILVAQL